ncbi:MAG: YeaH/YhbH family protein, partial [Gammaproteobacteria bacterium]|nr:YeaH/YhbH family protein [Gammaproteobacteria bacterium]
MAQFIDRRNNGKNTSTVSRQRFLNRFKKQIKESISKALSQRSITDIPAGEKISIPRKDIREPFFHHAPGGKVNRLFPGNKEFSTGDTIARPPASNEEAIGENASDHGEAEDSFTFEINKDEFLDFFFEDLELPDLVKTELKSLPQFQNIKSGLSTDGSPNNINITRSFRKALGRRIALGSDKRKKLKVAWDRLARLDKSIGPHSPRRIRLEGYINFMKEQVAAIPFVDTSDILYNRTIKQI